MENKNKLSWLYIMVFAIFCAVSVVYMNYSVPQKGTLTDLPLVRVYVKGEVKNPGVYELSVTDRVCDAVDKAGGVIESGDISALDLARFLEDGETITVPSIDGYSEQNSTETVFSDNTAKININTASKETLSTLNGIGESIASRIIDYREKNGNFEDIHDLLNVSGIGKKKFENIQDSICVK